MSYSKTQIQSIAEQTLRDKALPVDVIAIARGLGLDVFDADLTSSFGRDDVSGVLDMNEKRIYVQKDHSMARRRFSIAHEIGHYKLHYEGQEGYGFSEEEKKQRHISFRDNRSTLGFDVREIEANVFAANLLMPAHHIKQYYEYGTSAKELAYIFYVSEAAILVRLESLGLVG